ncbi:MULTISPECIES: chorismate synthase [Caproicibacterium]|jgi:chorismate synthase|uniref:Chorismate synthase n=1 Tax=Caproicibacterium lactatifermentans TaxID=2666138 RepID=A0ABX6PUR2_9FIRM|nr:chorismate synthase [Caproicibacterium lactatifermentans]MDD4808089.1 chorismate synthase [Oscillospiraceae bacterium]QKO30018.1 chorismate synthase [Caproicibacterium lactatifermentans]
MSSWGERVKISIFGESHGPAIGCVLEGLPAGEAVDMDAVQQQMRRRAPGRDRTSTPRREADIPQVLSGLLNGVTTGAPLCAVIANTNTRSADYQNLLEVPRPGHADYTAWVKYHGCNDVRGGGHFSGRLTAPLVFAGAVCRQILARRGILVGAHVWSIGQVHDTPFSNITAPILKACGSANFPVLDPQKKDAMYCEIDTAHAAGDSVGGVVECACLGVPAGLGGEGMFGGIESLFSSILFGIPACKGVEFGAGFEAAALHGSENNDAFFYDADGTVKTRTNNAGGILGGITTGMPILFRAAFKPTPSIVREQHSVNLATGKDTLLSVHGRHDPCIVPRAVPAVEAAVALALLNIDGILEHIAKD